MTPLIMNIDVEPVRRVVRGETADWDGFPELLELMTKRRPQMEDATGAPVSVNWCLRMDPQIEIAYGKAGWVFERYAKEIAQIQDSADTLGLHIHTWRPARRFFRKTWLAEFEDVEWITHCVRLAFETFQENVGHAPVAMSFGDNFMHQCALPIMEEFGVRADLSMSPGRGPIGANAKGELVNGLTPDYRHTPRTAFKPSAADFTRAGPSNYGFWEVPITGGTVGQDRKGNDKYHKLLFGIRPGWFEALITQALESGAPFIAGDARTDVVTKPGDLEWFLWALDYLERIAPEHGLTFSGLERLCDQLDAGELVTAA